MSPIATNQCQWHIAHELIDEPRPDVAVIEFLSRDIAGPAQARELYNQLDSLMASGVPRNLVIDFRNVPARWAALHSE